MKRENEDQIKTKWDNMDQLRKYKRQNKRNQSINLQLSHLKKSHTAQVFLD